MARVWILPLTVKGGSKATFNMKTARHIRNSAVIAVVLILGGCAAPMSAEQCRGADWYRQGYSDGEVYGLQAQIDQYAAQCREVAVDRDTYMAGWRDGYAEFRSRVEKTESP
jgi:hypothetical protein